MTGLQELHRRALQVTVDVVNQVSADQLGLRTPCSEWDLGQLLAHMVGQNHGFAAAARGERSDEGVFSPRSVVGGDPAVLHAASADDVAAAFALDDVLRRGFWLPEIRPEPPFPGRVAISFHLVDCVAHGWDVAEAIGVPVDFDEEVLASALEISRAVPDGPNREQPGASFRPGVKTAAGVSAFGEILGLLGRRADWRQEA
jgi:uncharacterized protein (TIGR03086 family)